MMSGINKRSKTYRLVGVALSVLLLLVAGCNLVSATYGPYYVFTAYGRAHGVGACMDGVLFRAQDGHGYLDIINAYYSGVEMGKTDDSQPIKVKCKDGEVRTYSLHDYLLQLAEEPDDYPYEGLKVLYVIARTYTLSCIQRGKHAGQGYDICSSGDCCQAFSESKDLSAFPNNVRACEETAGEIITYNGEPIIAAYCGSCGGHTDSYQDIFGQEIPYLQAKPDAFCQKSERFMETAILLTGELEALFDSHPDTSVGELTSLNLSGRTPGGRLREVAINGSEGIKVISGGRFAEILGFPSTRIFLIASPGEESSLYYSSIRGRVEFVEGFRVFNE